VFEPDLMRTVQLLPGTVARNDYSIGYNVRGGESDQNLVQLDGITIFNPSHVGGLFSAFDVDGIQEANFLTGGFPASYSGRLSSVLDVKIRPGTRDGVHGSGAVSLLSSKLLVEGPAGPFSYLVSARRSYADVVVRTLTSNILPFFFTDVMGKLDLPYGKGGDLALTGYWGRDQLAFNLIAADTAGNGAIDLSFGWGNHLAGLDWHQPLGGSAAFEQRVSFSEFTSRLAVTPSFASFDNVARLVNVQSTLFLKPGARHDLSLGLDAERYRMSYDIGTPALGDAFSYKTRYQPTVLSAFADEQWRPDSALVVRGGARLEKVGAASFTGVAPMAALKYFLGPDRGLTASVGRYHQAIESQRDQEIPISIYEFWVGANDKIPVARSDQAVLGLEQWLHRRDQITVEGYYKNFRNLVSPQPGFALQDPSKQFIPVEGYSYGLDVLLRRHVGKVNGWVAYSLVKAVRRAQGVEYPPSHDRRHTLNVVLQTPGPFHSDMGLHWGFGSPLPYTAIVGQWDHREYDPVDNTFGHSRIEPIGGPQNGARYPSYSRMDVGLHWHARRWGVLWQPYFEVVNVYDRKNVFTYFVDEERQQSKMTAIYQLPVLASFGMELSW
jgi:hypothetical protein